MILKKAFIQTPLGPMLAIADEQALHLLDFVGSKDLERKVARVTKQAKATLAPGSTPALENVERELNAYFAGTLKEFTTPLVFAGSPFQKSVWQELQKIKFGATCAYADLAHAIGKPTAFRAVALANAANHFAVVAPCHRVIKKNKDVCGYNSGVERKTWLLEHEKGIRHDTKS